MLRGAPTIFPRDGGRLHRRR